MRQLRMKRLRGAKGRKRRKGVFAPINWAVLLSW
jgi:hypothetical protein